MNPEEFHQFITELTHVHTECEWIEFKLNNSNHNEIGESISALANSCVLHEKPAGYLIWGISDNREMVGTTFHPKSHKIGNEELENWLLKKLSPRIELRIHELHIDSKFFSMIEIKPPSDRPVSFNQIECISRFNHAGNSQASSVSTSR